MAKSRREKEKTKMRYASAKERAEKHEKAFEPTALNVPEGVKFFKFKKVGTYRLDILPYEVGKHNPYCDEGMMHYERTYYVHRIPTANGSRPYCCLIRTFGAAKCPICKEIAKGERTGSLDADSAKAMKPQERQLFNIIDVDDKKAGVQIFEFNYFQFGKVLDAKTKVKEKYGSFFHLEGGRTVEVTVEENNYQGRTSYKPANIEFEEREDYDEDILEKVVALDAVPKEMDYDELKKIFLTGGDEEEEEDKKKGKAKDDDEEEEEEDDEDEDDKPKSKSKSKKKDKEEEEDDEEEDKDSPDDEDDEDEDDEDEDDAPKSKASKSQPNAKKLGLKVGDYVMYEKTECEIKKISGDGTSLTLEDQDDNTYKGVGPNEVTKVKTKEDEDDEDDEDDKPAKKAKGKAKDEDDEDDEDDDDDEPAAKKKGKAKDEEEDDDEDDEDDKPKGKAKGGKKKKDEDDDEEEEDDDD